jgi:solute carrier family 25 protein 44
VAAQLARQEGAAGFFRGVAPRMASSSIWGTAMVTSYEWLKRLCALPAEEDVQ